MRQESPLQFAKVKPHQVCVYGTGNRGNRGKVQNSRSLANLQKKTTNGYMSPATRRKVSGFLQAWIYTRQKYRDSLSAGAGRSTNSFQFVTLTLSSKQTRTDQDLRRELLMPFVQDLKRYYGLSSYFWKAEPQANGNTHFHLLFECKIYHQNLRRLWNKHQDRCGYIEPYRTAQFAKHRFGFQVDRAKLATWPMERQVRAFQKGSSENWSNPNSTDIHSIKDARSATAYVIKYCLKGDQARKIEGRIWGCSDDLRLLVWSGYPMSGLEEFEIEQLERLPNVVKFESDHFTVYSGYDPQLFILACPNLARRVLRDLSEFRDVLEFGVLEKYPGQAAINVDVRKVVQQRLSFQAHTSRLN